MKKILTQKPIKRSKIRLYLGKKFFTFLRLIQWYFSTNDYCKNKSFLELPYMVFNHRTPLIRKLRNVDIILQHNKIRNLELAIGEMNGVIIKPGQTFSYWKLIGRPTYKKGYLDGLVLNPDGTLGEGVGGGLCQLANLIFWMTLHTPLRITERHRHSHDIFPDDNRTQPFGSGATCVFNYMDLQIYNGTEAEYQLKVYLTEDYLMGEWLSDSPSKIYYEVYEREHYISCTFWGNYIRNNTLYRKVFNDNGDCIDDQFITENHAVMMYQPLLSDSGRKISP